MGRKGLRFAAPANLALHLDKPGFVQFLDWDMDSARRFVKAAVLALMLALAWKARPRRDEAQGSSISSAT